MWSFQSCFPWKFIQLNLNSVLSCVPATESNVRQFLSSIYLFFSSTLPLPRNSIRQMVVFKKKKFNRGSSLTLKVGHEPVRNELNFIWRKSEQICGDRRRGIRTFLVSVSKFDSPFKLFGCKSFKKVHIRNIISLKVFIRINWKVANS